MARQTRQQRRARRVQQPPVAGGPPRAPVRPTANGGGEPERERRPARPDERQPRGFGPVRFVAESIAELKKVEWPDQKAVVSGTAVVLIACFIVGIYLWLNDELWKYVVQRVLLR